MRAVALNGAVRVDNLAADQFLERGLVADRIEVRIVLCVRARPLRHIDRAPEVVDRVARPAREALAAGDVVEQLGVLRMSLDQYASAVSQLGVLARLVEGPEWGPEFPAMGFVRLSRGAAERDDRRLGLLGECRSLHTGSGEDESAGGWVHPGGGSVACIAGPLEEGQ